MTITASLGIRIAAALMRYSSVLFFTSFNVGTFVCSTLSATSRSAEAKFFLMLSAVMDLKARSTVPGNTDGRNRTSLRTSYQLHGVNTMLVKKVWLVDLPACHHGPEFSKCIPAEPWITVARVVLNLEHCSNALLKL